MPPPHPQHTHHDLVRKIDPLYTPVRKIGGHLDPNPAPPPNQVINDNSLTFVTSILIELWHG